MTRRVVLGAALGPALDGFVHFAPLALLEILVDVGGGPDLLGGQQLVPEGDGEEAGAGDRR